MVYSVLSYATTCGKLFYGYVLGTLEQHVLLVSCTSNAQWNRAIVVDQ